jgi:hypothetical protein
VVWFIIGRMVVLLRVKKSRPPSARIFQLSYGCRLYREAGPANNDNLFTRSHKLPQSAKVIHGFADGLKRSSHFSGSLSNSVLLVDWSLSGGRPFWRIHYRWLFGPLATYRFFPHPKIVFATTRLDYLKSSCICSLPLEDIINLVVSRSDYIVVL